MKVGQAVTAQVLEIDKERRRLRLGLKQLLPTRTDDFIGEHQVGDTVTGRVAEVHEGRAKVELGRWRLRAVPFGGQEGRAGRSRIERW